MEANETRSVIRQHYYSIRVDVYDDGQLFFAIDDDTSFSTETPVWLEGEAEWVRISETTAIANDDANIHARVSAKVQEMN